MDTREPLPPLAPLEEACTVVLLRDGAAGLEVLMLERPGTSRSFAGAWVFPGGKVDPADRQGPGGTPLTGGRLPGGRLSAIQAADAAARTAGLREVLEETGQLLRSDSLVPLSQWTPMQRLPRRYRTWFFLAEAPSAQVRLNPGEHVDHAWLAPAAALARHARGEMQLVPPTWVTLHQLAGWATVGQALEAATAATPFSYNSHLLPPAMSPGVPAATGDGGVATPAAPSGVVWAGDEAYPEAGSEGTAGARHRLTMTKLPWVFERTGF